MLHSVVLSYWYEILSCLDIVFFFLLSHFYFTALKKRISFILSSVLYQALFLLIQILNTYGTVVYLYWCVSNLS